MTEERDIAIALTVIEETLERSLLWTQGNLRASERCVVEREIRVAIRLIKGLKEKRLDES
jgi:hypothetical protein